MDMLRDFTNTRCTSLVSAMNTLGSVVVFSILINLSVCTVNRAVNQEYDTIWPIPQKYLGKPMGAAVSLSANFTIVANESSAILQRAIQRYLAIIMAGDVHRRFASGCVNATVTINKVSIDVTSQVESLDVDTSYDYSLMVDEGNAKIIAATIYGAM